MMSMRTRGLSVCAIALLAGAIAQADEVTLRFRYEITNPGQEPVTGAVFTATMPEATGCSYRVVSITSEDHPQQRIDASGRTLLDFHLGTIAPRGVAIVTASVELTPCSESAGSAPASTFAAGQWIEADDPAIVAVAHPLCGTKAVDTAASLFAYVVDQIRDDAYLEHVVGARATLEAAKGDCTDMALLFATLMRSCGFAARVRSGLIVPGSCVVKPAQFHEWAEYHDGTRWISVDPQRRLLAPPQGELVSLRTFTGEAEDPETVFYRCRVLPSPLTCRVF